jgi:hypothetical protein
MISLKTVSNLYSIKMEKIKMKMKKLSYKIKNDEIIEIKSSKL